MAKKKAGRAPHKVNGKPRAKKRHNSAATAPAREPRVPKAAQDVLPGMEQARHARLDNLCMSIGDAREAMNTAKADEEAGKQAALAYMAQHGVSVYKQHGIELVRVPGHDALRVRLVKGDGTVEVNVAPEGDGDQAEA